jgi:hypothetical protein
MAEFWYNSTHHSSLGCSPFKALYGYGPVLLAVPDPCPPATTIVQDWVTEKEAHNTMQQMLATAQNRMEIQADKKRTEAVSGGRISSVEASALCSTFSGEETLP